MQSDMLTAHKEQFSGAAEKLLNEMCSVNEND